MEDKQILPQSMEYILKKSIFEMFLYSISIIAAVSIVAAILERDGIWVILIYSFLAVSAVYSYRRVKDSEKYMPMAAAVIASMELVILPMLFFLDDGMFGPIPIWIAVNIMFCFLILERRILLAILLFILIEYSILLSRIYLYPGYIHKPDDRMETFADYFLCFMAAGIWIMTIIKGQEKAFYSEKRKIEESNDRIYRAGVEKNRMLEEVSHEFRVPMNDIIGMTELLLKEEADNIIRNEILNIKTASYDLLATIDDALVYSQLESGKIALQESSYCFSEMIENIIESVIDDISDKDLHFLVHIPPDMPGLLYGDSRLIGQIIMNLLLASVSMTPEGRIILDVGYEKEEESNEIMLCGSVSDTGRGMTQEEIDTVSEKSNALERVKLKFSVCREYLNLFGGTFSVKSLKDVGTKVSFTVKNLVEDAGPMIMLTAEEKQKILIYIDREENYQNWHKIMDGLRIETQYVSNRFHFETAIRDKKYDFIFLSKALYHKVNSIIAYYHCEDYTYVVGTNKDVYGDFGKCRLLRLPLSCMNVARVFNGEWQKEDYLYANNQSSFTAKGSRILVIDNNFTNLKIAAGIFKKYGIDIDIAFNGEDGLKKAEKEHYHLILVDMHMPDEDGVGILHKIRELDGEYLKKVPVIAVTSEKEENYRNILLKNGFQEYILKPIKIKVIEECMLRFLPEKYIIRKDKKQTVDTRKEEFVQEERGLNVRKGISNIGFNEDAYRTILDSYYHENIEKIDQLEDVFRLEEISYFISAVHGIKSTSASIGAMGLSALARELEYAGKEGNIGYISEKLPLFLKEYQLILNEIGEYLETHGGLIKVKENLDLLEEEEQTLDSKLLENLKDMLGRMNLKSCKEILDEISTVNYGQDSNEKIRKLKAAYEHFDFHTAKNVLGELIDSI